MRNRFVPPLDELAVLRELHDAVIAVEFVAIGDEDIAIGGNHDIARGHKVVRPGSGDSRRPERHQHLPPRAELDNLMPPLPFRRPRRADRVGYPHVAVAIDVDAMGPDEHPAAEARDYLAVGAELEDRIEVRIAAFVAESSRIRAHARDRDELGELADGLRRRGRPV